MPAHFFRLYIAVYVGQPTDEHCNRHVVLFFEAPKNAGYQHVTYHVKCISKRWKLEKRLGYNAFQSINIIGKVFVCDVTIDYDKLQRIMESVPIYNNPNTEPESSCQLWLGQALQELKVAGYVSDAARAAAVDGMFETVLDMR
ncbi:hypothetical protein PWT90_07513 [Aphanocladium album]|nr:hypothetical protein PWT90_07513 [Aphanocladium album]